MYLIHIVGIPEDRPSQWRIFRAMQTLGQEIQERLHGQGLWFEYLTLTHGGYDRNWNNLSATWLTDLRAVLDRKVNAQKAKRAA